MTIQQQLQKNAVGTLVELFTVDLTGIGGPLLYLTPNSRNGGAITFGSQAYTPFPIAGSGWETSIDGKQPQPTLSIGNVTAFIQPYLTAYQDCVGGMVTRTLTLEQYCAHGSTPDANQTFGTGVYVIYQMVQQNKTVVEFKLSSLIDRPGRKFPAQQVLRSEFPGAGLLRKS